MKKLFKKIILKFFYLIGTFRLISRIKSKFYFDSFNVLMGKNIKIVGLPAKIEVGNNINIYDNVIMHFGPIAIVEFGSQIIFSYNVLLAVNKSLSIGSNVQIGEFTSIRDTTHNYATNGIMMQTKDISDSIKIGNNVWIGRGCLILGGTIIEDGVVIGANSVVKGRILANTIYGGLPAKFIKNRLPN